MSDKQYKLVTKLYKYKNLDSVVSKLLSIDEAIESYKQLKPIDIEYTTQVYIDNFDNFTVEWKIRTIKD